MTPAPYTTGAGPAHHAYHDGRCCAALAYADRAAYTISTIYEPRDVLSRTHRWARGLGRFHACLGAPERPIRFLVLTTPLFLAIQLAIIIPLTTTGSIEPPIHAPDLSTRAIQIYGVLGAPLIETIITQWALFKLARLVQSPFALAFGLAWAAFAALHWSNGALGFIGGGVIGSLILCWTYTLWRRRSRKTGFAMTVVCHALHNALIIATLEIIARFWPSLI